MTTLAGLEQHHEYLVTGRELLREADRHLNGAMDSACGPWLNRRAVDALVDDLFRKYADDAGKVECTGFARVVTQRALAQREQAVEKAQADIFAETDPRKIETEEAAFQKREQQYRAEAKRRDYDPDGGVPQEEKSDG